MGENTWRNQSVSDFVSLFPSYVFMAFLGAFLFFQVLSAPLPAGLEGPCWAQGDARVPDVFSEGPGTLAVRLQTCRALVGGASPPPAPLVPRGVKSWCHAASSSLPAGRPGRLVVTTSQTLVQWLACVVALETQPADSQDKALSVQVFGLCSVPIRSPSASLLGLGRWSVFPTSPCFFCRLCADSLGFTVMTLGCFRHLVREE